MIFIVAYAMVVITIGLLVGAPIVIGLLCRKIAQLDAMRPRPPIHPVRLAMKYAAIGHGVATLLVILLISITFSAAVADDILLLSLMSLFILTLPIAAVGAKLFTWVALEPIPDSDKLRAEPPR